jgi:hypothetical protein
LQKPKRLDKFPAKYKNQMDIARSMLVKEKESNKLDSVAFITKQLTAIDGKNGWVYFFKYRVKKGDDWKIGISGMQPENEKEVNSNSDLVTMTDKKLKKDEPVNDQLQQQLKKLLFASHKSGKMFYGSSYGYGYKGFNFED